MFNDEIIKKEVVFVLNQLFKNIQIDEKEIEIENNYHTNGVNLNQSDMNFILHMKNIKHDLIIGDDDMVDLDTNPNTPLFFECCGIDKTEDESENFWGFFFNLTPSFESIITKKVYENMIEYEKDCIDSLKNE